MQLEVNQTSSNKGGLRIVSKNFGENPNLRVFPNPFLIKNDVFQREFFKSFSPKDFEEGKVDLNEVKRLLAESIDKKDYDTVFKRFGIQSRIEKGGRVLSEYRQPSKNIRFIDLGINENELLKEVYKIEKNADFKGSWARGAEKLRYIGGTLDLTDTRIRDLSALEEVGESALMRGLKISGIDNLKKVGKDLVTGNGFIGSMKKLEYIGGKLVGGSFLDNFPSIKYIRK